MYKRARESVSIYLHGEDWYEDFGAKLQCSADRGSEVKYGHRSAVLYLPDRKGPPAKQADATVAARWRSGRDIRLIFREGSNVSTPLDSF